LAFNTHLKHPWKNPHESDGIQTGPPDGLQLIEIQKPTPKDDEVLFRTFEWILVMGL
jgi:hypothetical protein